MFTKGVSGKILLTGGRAPVTLELSRLFGLNGYQVIVADSVPWTLCRHSKFVSKHKLTPSPRYSPNQYNETIENLIKHEQIEWLIPTCEEIFYIARANDQNFFSCQVLVDSFSKLKQLHNKWEFIQLVQKYNFRTPETYYITSKDELFQRLEEVSSGSKWVLKPVYSRFSSYLEIIRAPDLADPNFQPTRIEPWVMQRWIEGVQYCTYSVAHCGFITAHVTYVSKFMVQGGTNLLFKGVQHEGILNWVREFISHIEFTGQIAFDFIVTSEGNIYPIECNPRATSGIHCFQPEDQLVSALLQKSFKISLASCDKSAAIKLAMLGVDWTQVDLSDWLFEIRNSRDVILSYRDYAPFFSQWMVMWQFWRQSKRKHISIREAMTVDIEWNGEQ